MRTSEGPLGPRRAIRRGQGPPESRTAGTAQLRYPGLVGAVSVEQTGQAHPVVDGEPTRIARVESAAPVPGCCPESIRSCHDAAERTGLRARPDRRRLRTPSQHRAQARGRPKRLLVSAGERRRLQHRAVRIRRIRKILESKHPAPLDHDAVDLVESGKLWGAGRFGGLCRHA